MKISGGGGACLTVQQPGELCAVAEEKRDLETRGVEVYEFMTMQRRISRAQNDATRLGRVFPVQENDKTHATLQRLVPHDGGRQVERRLIFSCAEVLETAHVLEVDLPSLCALGPTSFWVWTGIEKQAVGVAPSSGDRVQIEADDFINIFLLRIDLLYLST